VPTLFVFGADGKTAASFYGAPPSLHQEAEAKLDALLRSRKGRLDQVIRECFHASTPVATDVTILSPPGHP
jgi:hypothetical protein